MKPDESPLLPTDKDGDKTSVSSATTTTTTTTTAVATTRKKRSPLVAMVTIVITFSLYVIWSSYQQGTISNLNDALVLSLAPALQGAWAVWLIRLGRAGAVNNNSKTTNQIMSLLMTAQFQSGDCLPGKDTVGNQTFQWTLL